MDVSVDIFNIPPDEKMFILIGIIWLFLLWLGFWVIPAVKRAGRKIEDAEKTIKEG